MTQLMFLAGQTTMTDKVCLTTTNVFTTYIDNHNLALSSGPYEQPGSATGLDVGRSPGLASTTINTKHDSSMAAGAT